MNEPATDLSRLGGPEAVARILDVFVRRMAADFVVGWLFEGKDLERIAMFETELAVSHLGGSAAYHGRPLGQVHGPLRIHRGQFRRRMALLRTVLTELGVPPDIADRWIAHDDALEAIVASPTDCVP